MRQLADSRGFTLIELLVVVAVIGIVAAIATPSLVASRIAANESSAIGSVRAITSAQADYNAFSGGYADDLATLASVCPGFTEPFISPDLAANGVTKAGYTFIVAAGLGAVAAPGVDCLGNPMQSNYYVSAAPVSFGNTGNRGFASNVAATIWQDTTGAVPTEPFVLAGTVTPLGK